MSGPPRKSMFVVALCAGFAVGAAGCSAAPERPSPKAHGAISDSYAVSISSAFSPDQSVRIMGGLVSWRLAIPELHLFISPDSAPSTDCDAFDVCIAPGTLPDPDLGAWDPSTGFIQLDPAEIDGWGSQWSRMTGHEMGHAMGLQHTGRGTLMAPFVTDMAAAPTATDVAQWKALRSR